MPTSTYWETSHDGPFELNYRVERYTMLGKLRTRYAWIVAHDTRNGNVVPQWAIKIADRPRISKHYRDLPPA